MNTQDKQLRELQKMASLGLLSAGIAHEIQNPLNFVINFSKMSECLLADMQEIVEDIQSTLADGGVPDPDDLSDLSDISEDLQTNVSKIQEHGQRAISIIQGILLLSRGKEGERLPTDVPHTLHEYVWLSYHAMRAQDKTFNVSIVEDYPDTMPALDLVPQDLSRSILNIANNAFYAVHHRSKSEGQGYSPQLRVKATYAQGLLNIEISDNGCGMPRDVQQKLFRQTVTTKPVGQGTGLGMSITHDLITNHLGGTISFESKEGEGATFKISIPCKEC